MIFSRRRLLFAVLLVAVFFLYVLVRYYVSERPVLDYLEKYGDNPVYIKAEIKDVSSLVFVSTFELSVYELNGEKANRFNLSLPVYGEIEAADEEIGDTLEAWVVFKPIEEGALSDSGVAWLKSGGYYIASDHFDEGDDGEATFDITPKESKSLDYYLKSIRTHAGDTFFGSVKFDYHDTKTEEAALVYAVFTGDREYIAPSVKADFKKAGIAHVLSVSGLHLSILCWIIFSFLNFLKVHKKLSCAAIILCCVFFMAFTGFSVSIIRACIMTVLFYLAFLAGRKSDPLTSLFFAGAVIVLLNPYNALNIGFQLSFFATLGIVATAGVNGKIAEVVGKATRFKALNRLLRLVASSFGVTLAATIFTLPFIAYNFKTLSLVSPLTNLLAAPLVTALLFFALCIMIFSFVPFLPAVFGLPAYYTAKLLLAIANWLGSFEYSQISVESTGGTGFYIYAALFLAVVVLCFVVPKMSAKKFVKPALAAALAVSFAIMAGSLVLPRLAFAESVRAAYYSDGKNQNIILFFGDHDSADIIDMTHGTKSHTRPVYNIMLENGAVHIDSVTLTDYRKRHVQMLKKYMGYSEIKRVYVPKPRDEYDAEVFNLLYYLSLGSDGIKNFELVQYETHLVLGRVLLSVTNFDYNKMRHMAAEIYYRTPSFERRLLYLGIGYMEGYEKYTSVNEKKYDIVFYGSHKHNRRDDDYVASVYGSFAGVLSGYLDGDKNPATQKLAPGAIEAYRKGAVLFKSDDHGSIVFEIKKDGELKYHID